MLVRIANREDPDQTACSEACHVRLGFYGGQQLFENLKKLQYTIYQLGITVFKIFIWGGVLSGI